MQEEIWGKYYQKLIFELDKEREDFLLEFDLELNNWKIELVKKRLNFYGLDLSLSFQIGLGGEKKVCFLIDDHDFVNQLKGLEKI